jgi:hypothetical protein
MRIGPNRINNVAIDVDSGIIARIFSAANPFQKTDPNTDVKCIAVRVPIKDGILTSEHNAAIETAKYNLIATGTVNLRTEGLALAVTPVVTCGLGLTEIPIVSLSGTFSAPSVGLTAGGAIKSAAAISATIAVPGLSNLAGSLYRKITADQNRARPPCRADAHHERGHNARSRRSTSVQGRTRREPQCHRTWRPPVTLTATATAAMLENSCRFSSPADALVLERRSAGEQTGSGIWNGCSKGTVYVIDDDADGGSDSAVRSAGWIVDAYAAASFLEKAACDGVGCIMLDVSMPRRRSGTARPVAHAEAGFR